MASSPRTIASGASVAADRVPRLAAVTSPVPREVWAALTASDHRAVVSQSLAWRDCVCADDRVADVSRLYQFQDGRGVIVPLVRRAKVPLRVDRQASWPKAWGVGGPITPDGPVRGYEARAVLDDLARLPALATQLHLRHDPEAPWLSEATGFRQASHTVYVVDLGGGFAETYSRRFHGMARKNVCRAERAGLEVQVDRSGKLLPVYLDLLEISVAKWARRQHEPLALARWRSRRANRLDTLERVAWNFGEACSIWVASQDGEPVASLIVLQFGQYAKAWKAAMNHEVCGAAKAANTLLNCRAIEAACDAGLRYFDLGQAREGSPLAAFKTQVGGQPHRAHELCIERLPVHPAIERSRRVAKRVLRFQDA